MKTQPIPRLLSMSESVYDLFFNAFHLLCDSSLDPEFRKSARIARDSIKEHPGIILAEHAALSDCAMHLAAVLPYAENEASNLAHHKDSADLTKAARHATRACWQAQKALIKLAHLRAANQKEQP